MMSALQSEAERLDSIKTRYGTLNQSCVAVPSMNGNLVASEDENAEEFKEEQQRVRIVFKAFNDLNSSLKLEFKSS